MLPNIRFKIRQGEMDANGRYKNAAVHLITVDDGGSLSALCRAWPKYLDSMIMHSLSHIRDTVRSCYGSGRWLANKPWIDNDRWRV